LFDYVVLTSVNRDDLEDGGASHFAECVKEIKKEKKKDDFIRSIIDGMVPSN